MGTLGEYFGSGASVTKLLLHLNGNSTDSSGNSNSGTDTNITYVDGKFGKCASFNGSSSKIGCGDTNFDWINYNTPFTINAWIKHNFSASGSGGEEPTIVGKHESANSPYPGFTFGMTRRTGVELNLDCQFINTFNVSGKNFTVRSIDMLPYQNIWTQVSMTYDGSGNASGMKFYVNGIAVPMTQVSASSSCNASITNNIQLGIGTQRYDSSANLFNGLIDEVIIENRAWSAQEVKKYYTNSRGFYATL